MRQSDGDVVCPSVSFNLGMSGVTATLEFACYRHTPTAPRWSSPAHLVSHGLRAGSVATQAAWTVSGGACRLPAG